jgi:hypothetical protein
MVRGCVFVGLAVAALALCGCSNTVQRLDLGEWHKYMPQEPSIGDEVSRSLKMSASTPRAPVARDLINRAEREEAVVSRSEFRPWARVDTKNVELLEADDDAQGRKRDEASRKTCRGC